MHSEVTQLLQQWHVPSTNEKLVSALLFDQVKVSKPASKSETLQSRLQQPSTYCMFAKHGNVDDIRKLEIGLKPVGTCDYLQGLLASNYCKPFEYQEFFEELPSKKHPMMQTYLQIKCTILQ